MLNTVFRHPDVDDSSNGPPVAERETGTGVTRHVMARDDGCARVRPATDRVAAGDLRPKMVSPRVPELKFWNELFRIGYDRLCYLVSEHKRMVWVCNAAQNQILFCVFV